MRPSKLTLPSLLTGLLMLAACNAPGLGSVLPPTVLPPAPKPTQPAPPTPTAALGRQRLPTPARAALARIRETIDGDTVVLDNGEHVRYVGINTPERDRPFYQEAKDYNRSLVEGREVRLEYDVEQRDRYGRLLAYIWLGDAMVNLEMVRNGYAAALTVPPNVRYEHLFRDAEQAARKAERGLWARAPVALRITGLEPDPKGPDEQNLSGEWVEIANEGNTTVDMRGYTLADNGPNVYTFPSFTLEPGRRIRLYTGSGKNSSFVLYWGSSQPIWNNGGDIAFLHTPDGVLVDSYEY